MVKTQRELEGIIWRATMMVLGLDPDDASQEVQKQVRISWPLEDTGSPNWSREESTTFIRVSPQTDNLSTTADTSYTFDNNGGVEHLSYYRCFDVYWVIYGDTAGDTSDKLRMGLLRQNIREYLVGEGLAFIAGAREVMRSSEQDATGEWWNRFDLQAQIYELAHRDYPVTDYIGVTPIIDIIDGR